MHWILLLFVTCNNDMNIQSVRYNSPTTCEEARDFFLDVDLHNNGKCQVYAKCVLDAALNNNFR